MIAKTDSFAEPQPELRRRRIAAGEARVAVFKRTYDAPIEDVWDACTNPDRLRRWYVPVTGDLRVGGRFEQAGMGSGEIMRCERPHTLALSLGGGADEIELRLSPGDQGCTVLELQHATTLDQHEIGGQTFDAIFCMGGGYYPRLVALDRHLQGDLPDDYDALQFHLIPETRPIIERGSAAMAALLEADGKTPNAPPASLVTGVDFVTVPARDFDASVHFYGTVLGLPFVKRWGDMPGAEFQAGNVTIAIIEPSAFGQAFQPHAVPIAFQVDDVAAARTQLEAQGVQFVSELIDSGFCHQAIFLDPAGNALDLHHRYAPDPQ